MNPRNQAGFTLVELLVLIGIILFLALLSPHGGMIVSVGRAEAQQSLSNMKQLHLASQQMALDRTTTGNTNWGWPGDTGSSFTNWTTQILAGGYLTTNELCKLLSAPGLVVPSGKIPPMNDTAVRVYAVTETSPGDAVFLTSANFTNTPTGGEALNVDAKPFGTNRFVVFRKGGDGAILRSMDVGQTNSIGSFVPLCH